MDNKEQKKYKTAFIYCIKSYQTDDIYIGSTAQRLSKRLSQHRSKYKDYLNGKFNYISSFEIVKYEDSYIELIESLKDVNKMEMEKIEGTYIKNMDCVNKFIAGRTKKEYKQDNKERISEYTKQYYKDNKEQIIEHQKQYYNDNKQQIIEQIKEYYNDNKQKILEQANQKHNCLCGGKYTTGHKARHEKTQKHLNYIKNN
jgi:hypothetical protein